MAGGGVSSYRDLKVWQEAMVVAVQAYGITAAFPREEVFGMTSQIRRAATSVATNIAEGYGRDSTRSYVHFLKVSQGSLKELETLLLICDRVSLAPSRDVARLLILCDELGKMLRSLIRSISRGVDND
ncbi:MAG TPA: four helix bundle protein [Aestuariivirgaceae bacterium]|jgi:four helix bundle protein|nr:four helix bundle protein [Aestuariivirgaceae bacterium]